MDGALLTKTEIEGQMSAPDFWKDSEFAKKKVVQLKSAKFLTDSFAGLQTLFDDIKELTELAEGEDADEVEAEVEKDLQKLAGDLDRFEMQRMLSGPDDASNAYLSIHAGAGGTESCDWVEMLLRMYTRWCERRSCRCRIIEMTPGEGAGLRSVTVEVAGKLAYGYLKNEIGVHRLVRISPFDANKRRHTSFASVDVIPEVEDVEIDIKEDDIKMDFYRASGPGGQHVNKASSAVRLTHIPTGVIVTCQNERSQHKNRAEALKLLKAKLHRIKEEDRLAESAKSYQQKSEIAFGSQIRSYVLHPYQMIKDHRTDVEVGNTQAVLDGDIDVFMEAYMKSRIGEKK